MKSDIMGFLVIPALDIKDRKCVQLIGGDPSKKLIELDDPEEVAMEWQRLGAKRLHLIDLSGTIDESSVNQEIISRIIKSLEIPIQFGGGLRDLESAMKFLDLGAEKVILGTMALKNPEILKTLAEKYGRERIIVALDSKDGFVVIKGWQEKTSKRASEVAREFEPYASEVLFTNVDVEGQMKGINKEIIKEMVESTSMGVIVSGGITTLEDIKTSKNLGASGVVIGSSLYTKKIDFGKALGIQEL